MLHSGDFNTFSKVSGRTNYLESCEQDVTDGPYSRLLLTTMLFMVAHCQEQPHNLHTMQVRADLLHLKRFPNWEKGESRWDETPFPFASAIDNDKA